MPSTECLRPACGEPGLRVNGGHDDYDDVVAAVQQHFQQVQLVALSPDETPGDCNCFASLLHDRVCLGPRLQTSQISSNANGDKLRDHTVAKISLVIHIHNEAKRRRRLQMVTICNVL